MIVHYICRKCGENAWILKLSGIVCNNCRHFEQLTEEEYVLFKGKD